MYLLRTDRGLLIARVSDLVAQQFIQNTKGHFEKRDFFMYGSTPCYVFDEGGIYIGNSNLIMVNIFIGYFLQKS